MASRLRWFILGNLIGIIILALGIMLVNPYKEKNWQESPSVQKVTPPTTVSDKKPAAADKTPAPAKEPATRQDHNQKEK